MQHSSPSIAKVERPQDAASAKLLLERHYPGLCLSLELPGHGTWLVSASGPCGSYSVTAPSPLRGATLTALCEMACTRNLGEGNV